MAAKKERFVQYSKKMTSLVTIFWIVYRLANFVVVLFSPRAGKYLVDLSTGVDTVMMINMGFYTGNSVSEKAFIAFGKRKSLYSGDDDKEDDDDEANNG